MTLALDEGATMAVESREIWPNQSVLLRGVNQSLVQLLGQLAIGKV